MKLKNINDLKGGEYLCKPVLIGKNTVLIYEGTCLKEVYIEKLRELGVQYVYVREEENEAALDDGQNNDLHENKINDIYADYKEKVKAVLERHIHVNVSELKKIKLIAEKIIEDIIKQDEIIENVENLRMHEPDIYEHTMNVCTLSVVIGLRMKLEMQQLYDIAIGGILHDIGFRYIPNFRIESDMNNYSRKEQMEFKKHTIYGYMAIEYENWLSDVSKDIILAHHERINGSGYPLKTKDLLTETQIVSICDEYDRMLCGFGCEKINSYQIVEYYKSLRGNVFDEKLLDIFLDTISIYPNGSIVKLNTGEEAVVVRQNEDYKDRPVIKKIKDKNGNGLTSLLEIDMIKQLNIFITEIIG